MTTDDLFNSIPQESTKVYTEDDYRHIYDVTLYVNVLVDSPDDKFGVRLMRSICHFLELNRLADFENTDEYGYTYLVLYSLKLRNLSMLSHKIIRLIKMIESAEETGAFLFLRLYEGNPSDNKEEKGLKLLFANIATKDVKIDTKRLIIVLNDIFNHKYVGLCLKTGRY